MIHAALSMIRTMLPMQRDDSLIRRSFFVALCSVMMLFGSVACGSDTEEMSEVAQQEQEVAEQEVTEQESVVQEDDEQEVSRYHINGRPVPEQVFNEIRSLQDGDVMASGRSEVLWIARLPGDGEMYKRPILHSGVMACYSDVGRVADIQMVSEETLSQFTNSMFVQNAQDGNLYALYGGDFAHEVTKVSIDYEIQRLWTLGFATRFFTVNQCEIDLYPQHMTEGSPTVLDFTLDLADFEEAIEVKADWKVR